MLRNPLPFLLALLVFAVPLLAKEPPISAVEWPADKPILHFEVERLSKTSSYQNQSVFVMDLAVKNVSDKRISTALFRIYLKDKQKIRIGDGAISISNVRPGETVKMAITEQTLGTPAEFSVSAERLPEELAYLAPPKLISTTVYSVPSGAKLTVDGTAVGVTPISVKLAVGTHNLSFEKEGFSPGHFPMTVSPDQLAGGSVTFELGGAQRDTVELRDGTVLTGDVQYMNESEVVMQVGGNLQKYSRNLVKKILLVEREIPIQAN